MTLMALLSLAPFLLGRVGVQRPNTGVMVQGHSHGLFRDRKSTRLNSSHLVISYAVFCLKKKKGELGTYLVSDSSAKPVRWRIRPPSFINLSSLPKMAEGHLLSDLIAINASVDIVMSEVD